MAIAKVQMPDGRIARYDVPEGWSASQVEEYAKKNPPPADETPKAGVAGVPIFPSEAKPTPAAPLPKENLHPLDLFGRGVNRSVADIISSVGQLGAFDVGDVIPALRPKMERSIKNEAAEVAARAEGSKGTGIAGTLGEITPHLALGGMARLSPTGNLLQRALQSGTFGGLYTAGTAPTKTQGDFAREKAGETATGAAFSAVAQPVLEAGGKVASLLGDFAKMRIPFFRQKKAEEEGAKVVMGKEDPAAFAAKMAGAEPGRTVAETTGEQRHADIYKAVRGGKETGARVTEREAERERVAEDLMGKEIAKVPPGAPITPERDIGSRIQTQLTTRMGALQEARRQEAMPLLEKARTEGVPDIEPVRSTIRNMISESGNPDKARTLRSGLSMLRPQVDRIPLTPAEARDLVRQGRLGEAKLGFKEIERPVSLEKIDDFRKWVNGLKDDPAMVDTAQQVTNQIKGLFPKESSYLKFLKAWEGESQTLDPFKSMRGKFATAQDFERFTKDPEAVARRFLSGDQSGAQELKTLWGGKDEELTKLVRSSMAGKISNMSPQQIGTVMKKNAGLLREFPEVAVDLERARVAAMNRLPPKDIVSSWSEIKPGLQASGALEPAHVSNIDKIVGDLSSLQELTRRGAGMASRADMKSPLAEARAKERTYTAAGQAIAFMLTGRYAHVRMAGIALGAETAQEMSKYERQILNAVTDMMLDPALAKQMAERASQANVPTMVDEIVAHARAGAQAAGAQEVSK